MTYILKLIYFLLPIGVANIMPVFFGNAGFLNYPVDFGLKIKGESVLGKNKTIGGVVVAVIFGALIFAVQKSLYQFDFIKNISLFNYTLIPCYAGFIMGFGAIFGDMVESFFKRRFKIKPGCSWFPFDQIDYVLGGIIVFLFFYIPTFWQFLSIILIGLILHIIVNMVGYYIGVRDKII